MSVTERIHFPAIRTTSCGASSNAINVEDLLYRAKRKLNQKTYRNRHINAVEQGPPNREAPQGFEVQSKGGEPASVEKKAAPKKQLKERSDTALDPIETQASRRSRKTPRANQTRKRYSLSELRQTVKLPTREAIDLKAFKFPQVPQTPRARRYLDWTPGSGFEGISLSSPTASTKRFRRRRLCTTFSRSSRSRHADRSEAKAVGAESSNAHRQEGEFVKRRLFAGGNPHNTAISTRHSVGDSEKPAEVATADDDEQWQPLCELGQQEVQDSEGAALAEETQNHQEALVGQALAEEPNRRRSLREWYHKTAKASCRDAEPSHTVLDVLPDSHTANKPQGTAIESGPHDAAIFPCSAYPHSPSSALQDAPVHNTQEVIPTSTPNEIADSPDHGLLHAPSSSLHEAATSGPKQSDMDIEITDQDTDKDHKSAQGSPSADEDWESMPEENPERETTSQNPDKETEPHEGSPLESIPDDGDWQTTLETNNDDDMNSKRPTAWQPDDEDMLDAVEEQQQQQYTPPAQPTPAPKKSSKRQRVTTGTNFTQAVPQLNSPSPPKPSQIPPRRKSTSLFNHPPGRSREQEAPVLHLGITPRLKRKLSEVQFKPPFSSEAIRTLV
ncbi:MAG: hypothetical protein Q9195_001447 [Heterodermia aff. obscurata]